MDSQYCYCVLFDRQLVHTVVTVVTVVIHQTASALTAAKTLISAFLFLFLHLFNKNDNTLIREVWSYWKLKTNSFHLFTSAKLH